MGHEVTIWTEKPEDAERLFNMIVDWMPSDEADNCTVSCHPESLWRDISTAPKDGTKIDLLYPAPRGRAINCYWSDASKVFGPGWIWREPTWDGPDLLPENQWIIHTYPNMRPTHWMPLPEPPERAP